MTDDLDTLRPEVRDALMHIRPSPHRFEINSWNCIRAELLRLARENAELRAAWGDALHTGTGFLKIERIDPARLRIDIEAGE